MTGDPQTSSEVSGLVRVGMKAWALVGIIVLGAIVYFALASISGLVVPLVVAIVIGMLFVPVVDLLEKTLPRGLASALVMVGILVVGVGTLAIAVVGIVDQAPQIESQIVAGLGALIDWLGSLGFITGDPGDLLVEFEGVLGSALTGVASAVTTVFSSVAGFLVGTFVALFILYMILVDWDRLNGWVSHHMGVPADLGGSFVGDATRSIRQYFYALTLSSLLGAVLIGIGVAALGLPLAFSIAVVTFMTSYVPYLGAIFSGAFAVLIALGSGGFDQAVIVLVIVLVAQNVVGPIVQTKLTGDSLNLHPIAVFGSTIVGAVLAGILGAMLSAPILALIVSVAGRVREYSPNGAGIEIADRPGS